MMEPRCRIVRHYKENLKKCSLEPLRPDPRLSFEKWKPGDEIHARGELLLEIDAPELTSQDAGLELLILDATWRYLPAMRNSLRGTVVARSLPRDVLTAYPRTARLSENPPEGLASIEALYAALRILGHRDDALLDAYYWRERFLDQWPI